MLINLKDTKKILIDAVEMKNMLIGGDILWSAVNPPAMVQNWAIRDNNGNPEITAFTMPDDGGVAPHRIVLQYRKEEADGSFTGGWSNHIIPIEDFALPYRGMVLGDDGFHQFRIRVDNNVGLGQKQSTNLWKAIAIDAWRYYPPNYATPPKLGVVWQPIPSQPTMKNLTVNFTINNPDNIPIDKIEFEYWKQGEDYFRTKKSFTYAQFLANKPLDLDAWHTIGNTIEMRWRPVNRYVLGVHDNWAWQESYTVS